MEKSNIRQGSRRRLSAGFYIAAAIIMAIIAGIGVWGWKKFHAPSDDVSPSFTLTPAKISELRTMVQLSTLDIYDEVPVKGHAGSRHLVGRMALEGSIGFDLEHLDAVMRGDTLFVTLPPEIVTLRESAAPDSYRVIDTWNDRLFGSAHFTTAEENRLKELTVRQAVARLYNKGLVRQARADARASLRLLLTSLSPEVKVIVITDPYPDGAPR